MKRRSATDRSLPTQAPRPAAPRWGPVSRLLSAGLLALLGGACSRAAPEPLADARAFQRAEAHYVRGLLALADGNFEGARFHFGRTLELEPDHAWARYRRAVAQQSPRSPDWNPGPARLGDLIPLPDVPGRRAEALWLRAWSFYTVGEWPPCAKDLRAAVERDPRQALSFWDGCGVTRDPERAARHYAELRSAGHVDFPTLLVLANALRAAGDPDGAREAYDAAVRAGADAALPRLARGLARFDRGELELAAEDFAEAMRIDPESVAASELHARTNGLLAIERPDVDTEPDTVTAGGPLEREAHLLAAASLGLSGQVSAALDELEAAHVLDPRHVLSSPEGWEHPRIQRALEDRDDAVLTAFRAAEALEGGDLEAARVLLDRLCAARPGFALGRLARAELHWRAGDPEAAREDLRAIGTPLARAANLEGNLERAAGRLDRARAAYRRAIELDPSFPWPHRNLALVLPAEERQRALELVTTAYHLDPGYARALETRADLFAALQNHPAARRDRRLARSLRP